MIIKNVSVESLKIKALTRFQCMSGCVHYKRNPMCPPACPDIAWFERLIHSYQRVGIYFENVEFKDHLDLAKKRKIFQTRLLHEEHLLKSKGNFYALCFFSGDCVMCNGEACNLKECRRPHVGRVPVCATGVDIMRLCEILKLPKEKCISYWKPLLSASYFREFGNKYVCLGLIFY